VRLSVFSATLALIVVTGSLVPASAQQQQDELRRRGDIACKASSNRLCSKHFGEGDMAILACLQQHKHKLAPSCRKFLTEIGQLN
jgi:hypothetical protein